MEITKEETQKIEELERNMLYQQGLKNISGGFCEFNIFNFDSNYIDIEAEFGIHNDIENTNTTEQFKFNRKTLKLEDC